MTVSQKLRKAITNFSAQNSGMPQEELLECAGIFISSAMAYSVLHRDSDDLVSEMQMIGALKWVSMQFADPESNLLGATEFTMMTIKQVHRKIVNEQMTLTDAIDTFSVLLTGLVMLGSTTDDPVKKAAQCEAIANAIRKTAMTELARVHGPLGEMN